MVNPSSLVLTTVISLSLPWTFTVRQIDIMNIFRKVNFGIKRSEAKDILDVSFILLQKPVHGNVRKAEVNCISLTWSTLPDKIVPPPVWFNTSNEKVKVLMIVFWTFQGKSSKSSLTDSCNLVFQHRAPTFLSLLQTLVVLWKRHLLPSLMLLALHSFDFCRGSEFVFTR